MHLTNSSPVLLSVTGRGFTLPNRQAGVSLIEILITVIVLAIGLLGLAAMQNTSVKFSYESYLRTQGSFLSYDLMDRIRANPDTVYGLSVGDEPTASVECTDASANCNAVQLAQADLAAWYELASDIFPDAEFELVDENNDGSYVLRISWEDRYESDEQQGEAELQQFVYNFDAY